MTNRARITSDWLPLPEPVLNQLQWKEGDVIEVEVVEGTLICTKLHEAAPTRPRSVPLSRRK